MKILVGTDSICFYYFDFVASAPQAKHATTKKTMIGNLSL